MNGREGSDETIWNQELDDLGRRYWYIVLYVQDHP